MGHRSGSRSAGARGAQAAITSEAETWGGLGLLTFPQSPGTILSELKN